MTVKKKRSGLITLIASAFIAVCGTIGVSISNDALTASAASSNRYIYFAYEYSNLNDGEYVQQKSSNSIATNVFQMDNYTTGSLLLQMNADTNGTGNFSQGGFVKGSSVSFTAKGIIYPVDEQYFIIKNSSNTTVASSNNAYCSSSYSDGTYSVEYVAIKRITDRVSPAYKIRITTSFKVDTQSPTISGASTSTRGKCTSSSFTVSASDSGSGVANLYWKSPTASSYSVVSSSKTVSSSSTNGLYSFYAVDNLGHTSTTQYVYLDTVVPIGTIKTPSGAVSSGTTVRSSFSYTATDSGSGINRLEYKTPTSSSWTGYTSGSSISTSSTNGTYSFRAIDNVGLASVTQTVILDTAAPKLTNNVGSFGSVTSSAFTVTATDSNGATLYYKTPTMSSYVSANGASYTVNKTQPDGKYYFYAVDGLGNTSATVNMELSVEVPSIEIVRSIPENSVCVTWTESGYTVTLNGNSYSKGSWIRTEGDYTVVATNTYGRQTTKTFTIGHSYYVASVIPPTCTAQGYSRYKCQSCTSTYNADYVPALGHSYTTELIEPTCATNGYVLHSCIRCTDEYQTDITPALGHKYVTEKKEPTCTEDGGIFNRCAVCDYTYMQDVVYAKGHSYVSEVTRAVTCTTEGMRKHTCDECGDTYTTKITATGHHYTLESENNANGLITRVYRCTVCGDSYTEEVGEQYDMVSEYVVFLFEEYQPYLIWVFLATAGIWSIVMGIMMILAHKNEDKEKAKKMLVNYIVGMVVIFVILVACPLLIKGIASLIT